MPRSMWRGAISFGMVAIPVRLYLATESKSVSFRLLCPNDQTPVRNKRWCPEEDREIGWSEALRGYEVGKDEYVIVTDADLDELPADHDAHDRDRRVLPGLGDRSRRLPQERVLPGAGGGRRQAVCAAPSRRSRRPAPSPSARSLCATASISAVLRSTSRACCSTPCTGRTRSARRASWRFPSRAPDVAKKELDMAVMLVENMSAHFDPARYHDDYREALIQVVEAKLNNQPIERPEVHETGKVTDLMAALKASVEAAKSRRTESAEAEESGVERRPNRPAGAGRPEASRSRRVTGRASLSRAALAAFADPLPFRSPTPPQLPGYIPIEASVPCAEPFDDHDWLFSVDWDGARALLFLDPGGSGPHPGGDARRPRPALPRRVRHSVHQGRAGCGARRRHRRARSGGTSRPRGIRAAARRRGRRGRRASRGVPVLRRPAPGRPVDPRLAAGSSPRRARAS